MNYQFIFIVIALIVGVAIFLGAYFNKKATIKRKLRKAPVKRVFSFVNGEVAKLVGKVELVDEPLVAPLSNRKCSYYHILVEQQVSSGKSSHWKKLIEEEVSCKFVIRDGNSHAFIQGKDLKSHIIDDRKYRSGFLQDATEGLERYLNRHGYKSENVLGLNKTIRYKEGVLEKEEEVAVMGKGEWKEAGMIDLPDYYGRVLVVSATEDDFVYLSDDPATFQQIN